MSFYRTLIATVAAIAIASPVFADDVTPASSDVTPAAVSDTNSMTPAAVDTKVNINTATAKDLMKVKGMNAAKARAIVSYRKKHGNFKSLDDMSKVKGFMKMKTDDMKAMQAELTV